jgi:hypothetical protein
MPMLRGSMVVRCGSDPWLPIVVTVCWRDGWITRRRFASWAGFFGSNLVPLLERPNVWQDGYRLKVR